MRVKEWNARPETLPKIGVTACYCVCTAILCHRRKFWKFSNGLSLRSHRMRAHENTTRAAVKRHAPSQEELYGAEKLARMS